MDLAYIEVLETNKVLRDELNSEVNINILNEKKIRKYLYKLEQCHKTISFQDTTIIAQESENQELRSQVSKLKKCLRIALEDIKKKESYIPYLEQKLINLEDEVPFSRDAILKKLRLISTASNRLQEIAQNNQPIDQRITQLQNQYDTSQGILNLTRTAFTNEQRERRQKHIKYTKWKDREKNSRQIINNLNQPIFAL
ncbi:hypothetical protein Glove_294g5 [Diversispora epigaea]|uniref:Uncharacterized protein n=1 Tax=Diversispora epigaea TaxID=1348612 RepID=A0A397HZC6_9GLOM|nr:hypothetical protein Glove_294g5 [Diversispora epigaea]